jgi:sulfite exporter TauE/SafE
MWNGITIALALGFLGSFHCAGMCGSLMLYNFFNVRSGHFVFKFAIYHLFRILSYVLLGILFGQIGFIGSLIGLQKFISVISGIILIFVAMRYFFPVTIKFIPEFNYYEIINSLFSYSSSSNYRFMISGLANGFLPCGFSLIAVMFATTTYSLVNGAIFMFFFGVATIPALLFVTLLSQQIKLKFINYVMPALALISGVLLILRTMNLGIPYISPEIEIAQNHPVIECHK